MSPGPLPGRPTHWKSEWLRWKILCASRGEGITAEEGLISRPKPSDRVPHNLAPGPDIHGPAPSPTTPPPPRNPRQAAHRRCPNTGTTQPPGPRSAPLPPPLTTAGFRGHRKESAPNGAVSAPSRVLRPVHHSIPRPPCRPPPAPRRLPLKFPVRPGRGEGGARGGGVKPENLTTP